jgi:hypothetical protein
MLSKRDLENILARLINERAEPLYAADVQRIIEERIGIDVDMHRLLLRLNKLAFKHRIAATRETTPPYRQRFSTALAPCTARLINQVPPFSSLSAYNDNARSPDISEGELLHRLEALMRQEGLLTD